MYCTADCTCSLCRELRGYRLQNSVVSTPSVKASKSSSKHSTKPAKTADMFNVGNSNFILLRRSKTEVQNKPQLRPAPPPLRHLSRAAPSPPVRSAVPSAADAAPAPAKVALIAKSRSPRSAAVPQLHAPSRSDSGGESTTTASHLGANDGNSQQSNRTDSNTAAAAAAANRAGSELEALQPAQPQHKVIIYFGDSLSSKQQMEQAERVHHQTQQPNYAPTVVAHAPVVPHPNGACSPAGANAISTKPPLENLPSFVESVQGNVINIRVEGSYARALDIVRAVTDHTADVEDVCGGFVDDYDHRGGAVGFDWSFVQNWRSR